MKGRWLLSGAALLALVSLAVLALHMGVAHGEDDGAQARLEGHVTELAVIIGERHAGRLDALNRAAKYIEDAFGSIARADGGFSMNDTISLSRTFS